jgi:hypothetical protein
MEAPTLWKENYFFFIRNLSFKSLIAVSEAANSCFSFEYLLEYEYQLESSELRNQARALREADSCRNQDQESCPTDTVISASIKLLP